MTTLVKRIASLSVARDARRSLHATVGRRALPREAAAAVNVMRLQMTARFEQCGKKGWRRGQLAVVCVRARAPRRVASPALPGGRADAPTLGPAPAASVVNARKRAYSSARRESGCYARSLGGRGGAGVRRRIARRARATSSPDDKCRGAILFRTLYARSGAVAERPPWKRRPLRALRG